MRRNRIEQALPGLKGRAYDLTSSETEDYNCIAWALGDVKQWWWFTPKYVCYWPPGVQRDNTLETMAKIFELHGYSNCPDDSHEPATEKVALYEHPEFGVEHVARQLKTGKWASKLGDWEDIENDDPYALECEDYGRIVRFMKRIRKDWQQ